MARVLLVCRYPLGEPLPTYLHNMDSLLNASGHQVYCANMARMRLPRYLASLEPDLVIFHYTFLSVRTVPEEFDELASRIAFLKDLECRKAAVVLEEQMRSDILSAFMRDFGVTHVFTPAPPDEWPRIYAGVDFNAVTFKRVLTGYVDEATARALARRADRLDRPIDIGYRSWYSQPFYGSHGQLKGRIGDLFKQRACEVGLVVDISRRREDAFIGNRWFEFLLRCKYTVGVEGGSSVFDRDGRIAMRTLEYLRTHDDPPFEEVRAACFPHEDGEFKYYLPSPRHLEAVMTKTCQVLVEGEYGGALKPGLHYIELKRDFSNIGEVLELIRSDARRATIVERAYRDVVLSGDFSYSVFAETVIGTSLDGVIPRERSMLASLASIRLMANHLGEHIWRAALPVHRRIPRSAEIRSRFRRSLRPLASSIVGEDKLRGLLARMRRGQS